MINNLYKFINSNSIENKHFELLSYEFDSRFYHYGDNFILSREGYKFYKFKIKLRIYKYLLYLRNLFSRKRDLENKKIVINSAYFNLQSHFCKTDFVLIQPPWDCKLPDCMYYNFQFLRKTFEIKEKILFSNFSLISSNEFKVYIDDYIEELANELIRIGVKSIFLSNDLGFFEKIIISISQKYKITTFNFIHGLPGVYNIMDNNRCDYLVVWGKEIKSNFIKAGFDENKILVSGHPKIEPIIRDNINFSLENILILGKSLPGSHWSHNDILPDRSNLIYYLLSIQSVLIELGVEKVRFRPHPSENVNWYLKYLDNNFFIPDTQSIDDSINESTLIIGPTSSVFIESINAGVNYVVYEPKLNNGFGLDGYEIIAPFDGSNKNVPIANDTLTLKSIILKRQIVNKNILLEYLNDKFDLDIILNKIK